jgi:hypothetical protein
MFEMATSNIKVTLDRDIQSVWKIVTSLDNYQWRSDLSKIEVLESGKVFMEYTKEGYSTTFTITAFEPMKRYEFDMENENLKGRWIGLFFSDGERTSIDFTEIVSTKKLWMKPFVKAFLKKQQAVYIEDLRLYLEKRVMK